MDAFVEGWLVAGAAPIMPGRFSASRPSGSMSVAGDPVRAGGVARSDSYEDLEGDDAGGLLILVDHASNFVPPEYQDLGLSTDQLERHIAFDIGAAPLARTLAERFRAPAILTRFSRLLIDPNRGEDDPTLIMRLSDGVIVPGNAAFDALERERRLDRFHRPYHQAIRRRIEIMMATGTPPVLLSIHSYTPVWKAARRPWHAGILWDRDRRFAGPLIARLSAEHGLRIGDNEPYLGSLKNDTMYRHGTAKGLAHALLEVRNDLIDAPAGVLEWADRLEPILKDVLADRSLHEVRQYGSLADDDGGRAGGSKMTKLEEATRTELEAAAFRRLIEHLRNRTDVQNIDLMNLAGFCRNCLSNWYREAAEERGLPVSKEESREMVYGMPYDEWRTKYQTESSPAVKATLEKNRPSHG